MIKLHTYLLLLTGLTIFSIGVIYCIDPNLLLSRYELAVSSASDDNMYRGAYGGLFMTLGAAICYGFIKREFMQTATIISLLFMGGFALGRISSIAAVGQPHSQIVGLLVFEVVTSLTFGWLLFSNRESLPRWRVTNP